MPLVAEPLLSTAELLLWSATAGAVGVPVLLAAADAVVVRRKSAWRTLAYLACCAAFVMVLSGLPDALWPETRDWLHVAQVLLGPVCAAIGCNGISQWLFADQRDRFTRLTLGAMTAGAALGAPLCLVLTPASGLPAAAALSVTTMAVALWMAVRAAQRGDRLAWGLAAGCLLTLPAQLGLYQIALATHRPSLGFQAAVALTALCSLLVTGWMIWRRNRESRMLSRSSNVGDRDLSSGLFNGLTMLQKIINSQRNRRKTGGDGALMAVMVFETKGLLAQLGHSGLDELYNELALRMRRHSGVVNPAGRYYDHCFLVLFETLHSPRMMRTLGLRVASSLRRPVEVTSLSGERLMITVDIGVGIIQVSNASTKVDDLLHHAQAAALAARHTPARAALINDLNPEPVAVENAELGSRWSSSRLPLNGATSRQPGRRTKSARARTT